ncbi:hypothetical protein AURDEDRAFT_128948 [Auricularia subglabra TFB-10046 SS5]|nr:hypothetical protein AURDEDRAFT_128948 [Auricularia subglabra TFB-10046 SS5]
MKRRTPHSPNRPSWRGKKVKLNDTSFLQREVASEGEPATLPDSGWLPSSIQAEFPLDMATHVPVSAQPTDLADIPPLPSLINLDPVEPHQDDQPFLTRGDESMETETQADDTGNEPRDESVHAGQTEERAEPCMTRGAICGGDIVIKFTGPVRKVVVNGVKA